MREGRLELADHLGAGEGAGHGRDHVGGVEGPSVEGHEVVAGERLDRRLGREVVREVALAVEQHVPLRALDVLGVVVALLHLLERLLLGQGQAVLLEARLAQHLHEELERLVEVVGEAVEAGRARGGPDAGRDLGGQEVEPLVELLRR